MPPKAKAERPEDEGEDAAESKRLLARAMDNGILSSSRRISSASLPPTKAMLKANGKDIVKRGSSRRGRYLLGTLAQLDSRNPVMYIDFPQGRLKLFGTLVFPRTKYCVLRLGAKEVVCEDVLESMIVFSEAWWVGTREANPKERRLPLPPELAAAKLHEKFEFGARGGAPGARAAAAGGGGEEEGEEGEEEQEGPASQRPVRAAVRRAGGKRQRYAEDSDASPGTGADEEEGGTGDSDGEPAPRKIPRLGGSQQPPRQRQQAPRATPGSQRPLAAPAEEIDLAGSSSEDEGAPPAARGRQQGTLDAFLGRGGPGGAGGAGGKRTPAGGTAAGKPRAGAQAPKSAAKRRRAADKEREEEEEESDLVDLAGSGSEEERGGEDDAPPSASQRPRSQRKAAGAASKKLRVLNWAPRQEEAFEIIYCIVSGRPVMQQGCRGSAPRTHGGPGVLELPELVLEHVFSLLEDTQSKLRCALACSAFARVLGRPSAACWPEARLAVRSIEDAAERARAASFLRWALARAPHLQSIDLDLWSRDHASAEGEAALRPALEALLAAAAPSARIVRLRWGGPALAVDGWVGGASQLTCLALSSYAVSLPSCLGGVTSLRRALLTAVPSCTHLELSTVSDAGPGLSPGCLPTSLRKMVSIPSPSGDAGGTALPAAILSLPLLEYLDVSESEFSAEPNTEVLEVLLEMRRLRPTLQVRAVESDQFFVAEPQPEDMEEGAAAEGVDALHSSFDTAMSLDSENELPSPSGLESLPDEALERVFALVPFRDRAGALPLVCRRFAGLLAGPGALWPRASFAERLDREGGLERLRAFLAWLLPRAACLEELELRCSSLHGRPAAAAAAEALHRTLARVLAAPAAPFALRMSWPGIVRLEVLLTEPCRLRQLVLLARDIEVDAADLATLLPELTRLELQTSHGPDLRSSPSLPPCLERVLLSPVRNSVLPEAVAALPRLRYLDVSGSNQPERLAAVLPAQPHITALVMDWVDAAALPEALSCLRHLRLLSLHGALYAYSAHAQAALMDSLGALSGLGALESLSLAACSLPALPPAVAAMTQLRALHVEANSWAELPPGPYLERLRLLSTDWRSLFASCRLLAAAPRLHTLCLSRPLPARAPRGDRGGGGCGAAAAEAAEAPAPRTSPSAVLACVGAMPALRRVLVAVSEDAACTAAAAQNDEPEHSVDVARVMLGLSRCKPGAALAAEAVEARAVLLSSDAWAALAAPALGE
eukprot:scaffold25.g5088.t1